MNVLEFLTEMRNDELSDMFSGNRNSIEEERDKLLPIMNKAMLQAYAKHDVIIKTTQLTVTSDVKTYDIGSDEFTDPDPALQVLQIVAVVNSYGRELDAHECRILGTVLYFPDPKDVELQVVYKEKPARFTEAQDDEVTEVVLPDLLYPWMSSWVAARLFLSKKDDASVAAGTKLLALASSYEQTFIDTNTTNQQTREDSSKLEVRGFA
jgi:hypothetical protein